MYLFIVVVAALMETYIGKTCPIYNNREIYVPAGFMVDPTQLSNLMPPFLVQTAIDGVLAAKLAQLPV